jgi:hypothetical protein
VAYRPSLARTWAWLGAIFDECQDLPIERAGQFAVVLASGRADAMSGPVVSGRDDFEDLVRDAEAIRRADRYALRVRT